MGSEELVDRFLDAIWMERGLSANTLGAYRADSDDARSTPFRT